MSLLFIDKVPGDKNAFEKKVKEISYMLGINPEWLMFVINFESGGTFSASVKNAYGCIGLIQFCPDSKGGSYKTIGGKVYTMDQIRSMTNVQQLDLAYMYYKDIQRAHGRFDNYYDLYFATLWPDGIGKPSNYILNTSTNPAFDLNKNGVITAGEVRAFLDNRVLQTVPAEYQDNFKKKEIFCKLIKERLSTAA